MSLQDPVADMLCRINNGQVRGRPSVMMPSSTLKEAIARIRRDLNIDSVEITGNTPMQQRQANVDRFQTDPNLRVFVGNIQAAGVGLTLTAADTVVFEIGRAHV